VTTVIHPTAIIDPSARIGEGVEIGPWVMIGPRVTVGDRCRLGPRARLQRNVLLAEEVSIGDGSMPPVVTLHLALPPELGDTQLLLAAGSGPPDPDRGCSRRIRTGVARSQ